MPGNCCSDTDCGDPSSARPAPDNHTCSACDAVAGNTYYVDPVNGNDSTGTGSDMSGGAGRRAALQDHRRAPSQVIGTFAGAGTKVDHRRRGQHAARPRRRRRPADHRPANITLTTTGGPITIILPAATSQAARTTPRASACTTTARASRAIRRAPLILDGNNHTSGFAIQVSPGTATHVEHLERDHPEHPRRRHPRHRRDADHRRGRRRQNAGIAGRTRDGLHVSGGVANINMPRGTPDAVHRQHAVRHRGQRARLGERHRHAGAPSRAATAPS